MSQFFYYIINKNKTEYKKIREASVSFLKKTSSKWIECKSKRDTCFLKNRIIIERARVGGSNKDGRDVFLADSWRWLRTQLLRLSCIETAVLNLSRKQVIVFIVCICFNELCFDCGKVFSGCGSPELLKVQLSPAAAQFWTWVTDYYIMDVKKETITIQNIYSIFINDICSGLQSIQRRDSPF